MCCWLGMGETVRVLSQLLVEVLVQEVVAVVLVQHESQPQLLLQQHTGQTAAHIEGWQRTQPDIAVIAARE